jgi:hypothetical protein
MASFQLIGIPPEQFAHLFELSPEKLARRGMARITADAKPGYPCRVSLQDAEPGETLLLLPYEHQPALSPYRASGPVYVRQGAAFANLQPGVVPSYVTVRLISIRSYDARHMMTAAEVRPGGDVADEIEQQFRNPDVAYIHLHNAKRGCFSCRVDRAR